MIQNVSPVSHDGFENDFDPLTYTEGDTTSETDFSADGIGSTVNNPNDSTAANQNVFASSTFDETNTDPFVTPQLAPPSATNDGQTDADDAIIQNVDVAANTDTLATPQSALEAATNDGQTNADDAIIQNADTVTDTGAFTTSQLATNQDSDDSAISKEHAEIDAEDKTTNKNAGVSSTIDVTDTDTLANQSSSGSNGRQDVQSNLNSEGNTNEIPCHSHRYDDLHYFEY